MRIVGNITIQQLRICSRTTIIQLDGSVPSPIEMAAAKAMLDDVHADLPVHPSDHNTYIVGRIDNHKIAIACLPSGVYGTTPATRVATQILSSFKSIRFGLMVGIEGRVPSRETDIRPGNTVVSKPTESSGGVVQYDYHKAIGEGHFECTSALNKPPRALLTAVAKLQADHILDDSRIPTFLSELTMIMSGQGIHATIVTRVN
jgi:hypothetical protein